MSAQLSTFSSYADFIRRFIDIFRGPSFISVLREVDPLFREKILLAVSMANNCAG